MPDGGRSSKSKSRSEAMVGFVESLKRQGKGLETVLPRPQAREAQGRSRERAGREGRGREGKGTDIFRRTMGFHDDTCWFTSCHWTYTSICS
jgi:hypothetical protein